MSLTITIDRTEAGRFRAEVAEYLPLVIEHDEISELVEELKRNLDLIAVMPGGGIWLADAAAGTNAGGARAEIERRALRNGELDELSGRYPAPGEGGHEPAWSEAL